MNDLRLYEHNTLLLVVDVQEKLFKAMNNREELKKNIIRLLKTAELLNLPAVFLEQNPQGLGDTIKDLKNIHKNQIFFSKMTFGLDGNDTFFEYLENLKKNNIILCGIETHVCVYQCGSDLLKRGYNVHIAADAVSSRKSTDHEAGINRLVNENAVWSSTESAIFDLLKRCDRKEFKPILELVK